MEAVAIIGLIEEFGPPAINLVEMLITKAEAKQSVSWLNGRHSRPP